MPNQPPSSAPPGGGSGPTGILLPTDVGPGATPPSGPYHPPFVEAPYPQQTTTGSSAEFPGGGMVTQWGSLPNPNPYDTTNIWAPANNPDSILTLQQALVTAGLVPASSVRPGVWDATSATAYKGALELANYYGATVQDTLAMLAANPKLGSQNGSSGIPKAAFPLTSPETISGAVSSQNTSNVAQQELGQNLSPAETADFTKFYQGQEASARQQYMSATGDGPGNFYTSAPSLDAAAQDYIKSHNLNQAVAYGTAQRALQFFSMLHGAGGTGANLG